MDIKVRMKSGKEYRLHADVYDIQSIVSKLNKNKFVYFGPIILNVSEIESVEDEKRTE